MAFSEKVRSAALERANQKLLALEEAGHPDWPSPAEIEERAAMIRSEWTPRTFRMRAGLPDCNSMEVAQVVMGGQRRYFDVDRPS